MASVATEVSTTALVDTKRRSDNPKRRQWPEAAQRRIVAETLEPGSSVSIVARRHDVNANQVFKWRREIAPAPNPAPSPSAYLSAVSSPQQKRAHRSMTGRRSSNR